MAWCNDGGQLFSALHNKIVIILPMYLREHKEKVQDANHFRCQTAWSHQLSLAPLCTRNGRNCRSKSPSLQSIRLSTTTNPIFNKWNKARVESLSSKGWELLFRLAILLILSLSLLLCWFSNPTCLTHWHILYHTHSSRLPRLSSPGLLF